ncbi:MAG TPA: glucose-6-phosphate dehydrogenase assembly protein OpcA, partial [Rubrobacter sp.]|nr:glucose-6-phosphate dehydrogenase assembly protein OpcA [Rubrobacter sp.]
MIGESRQASGGGRMSVAQVEHELAKLRTNEDGTLALRSSVLNLIVVTDEDSAPEITNSVSKLAGQYPARAVVFIADPDGESNVNVQLSAFCNVRGGGGAHVCAEQVTIHAEGPPATHLESLAGPLLIPDLPVFLWYPGEFSPHSPEFAAMAELADRVIVDSATTESREGCLHEIAALLEDPESPAIGDLQWVGLSPWRSLLADTFGTPERAGELEKIERAEVLYAPGGENRALLLVGWLASTLGWGPENVSREGNARLIEFSGPSGTISVELSPESPDA